MPSGERMTYGIDFDVNKQQLAQLQNELQRLQKMTTMDLLSTNSKMTFEEAKQQLNQIRKSAGEVQTALTSAFNVKLDNLNVSRLQNELNKLDINRIYSDFQKAGAAGIRAFNQIPSAVMKTNLQLRESHSLLDKISSTMTNTIKWGFTSSVFNHLTTSMQSAWNYTKALDSSLNDIRIVSEKSADDMERFAVQANRAAQALGSNTKDYTNAALIYYQQGLDDATTKARTETTIKAANVTGQSGRDVSEQLTAIWNGYKVSAAESEVYIDKVAKVAAATAADLEEMATGMSKVASAANSAGVDIDQLNATLATVISVTREAPETIGSAFKTIYARLGDLKLGNTDEDGVGLGSVSSQLKQLGVEVLNQQGDMRDMGDIIEDVAEKWQGWTQAQRQAASVAMAGKMQYSRLIALFDNWDMYTKTLEQSKGAIGELDREQEIYMEKTSTHLNQLESAWERVFGAFVDNKGVNDTIDVFTDLTNGLANFVEALGGGGNVLLTFGSILTQVLSKDLAHSINISIKNMNAQKANAAQLLGQLQTLENMQAKLNKYGNSDAGLNARVEERRKLQSRVGILNNDQILQANDYIDDIGNAVSEQEAFSKRKAQATSYIQGFANQQGIGWDKRLAGKIFDLDSSQAMSWASMDALTQGEEQIDGYISSLSRLKQAQNEAQKATDRLQEVLVNSAGDEEKVKAATEAEAEAYRKLGVELKAVQKDMNSLSKRKDIGTDQKADAKQVEQQAARTIKEANGKLSAESQADINKITKAASDAIDNAANNMRERWDEINAVSTEIANGVEEQLGGAVDAAKDRFRDFLSDADREALIKSFLDIGASVTQIASAFNNLGHLGDILNNDDLSTWEKFLQISMNLGMSLPMLVNGFMTLGKNFQAIGTTVKTAATSMAVHNIQLKIKNQLLKEGYTAEVASAQAEAMSKQMTDLSTGSIWAEVAALTAKKALMAVGVVAAIGLVVGATYLLIKAYNEDADAAKKANEAAKELAKSHQDVQQQLNELKSSFDAYTTAKEKLEDCVQGTTSWKEALAEVNETAIDLINNLGRLSTEDIQSLYERDKTTGLINFNTEGMKNIIAKQEQLAISSQYATAVGQQRAAEANVKAQVTAERRAVANRIRSADTDKSTQIKESSSVGSSTTYRDDPNFYRALNNSTIYDNLDKFKKSQTLDEFKASMEELGVNFDQLADNQIIEFQNKLHELALESDAASEKLSLITQLAVEEQLGDKYDSAEQVMASNMTMQDEQDKIATIIETELKDGISIWSGSDNKRYRDMLDRLQKAGFKYTATTDNPVLGTDSNRRLAFIDENGDRVERTAEWIANQIAASEALNNLAGNAEKASSILSNLEENVNKDLADGIKNWITNSNFETMTSGDLAQLQQGIDAKGGVTEYLKNILNVDEDTLKSMFGDDFADKFSTAMQNAKDSFDHILDKYADSVKEAFSRLDTSKVSLEGQKQIGKLLQQILVDSGKDAMNATTDLLSKMKPADLSKFVSVFNSTDDWFTIDVNSLKRTITEAGIQTKFTDEELETFIDRMKQITAAAEDFTSIQTKFAEAQKAVKGIKIGDTIDKDAYKALSPVAQDYFTMMLDGTYKLVRGADLLNETIKSEYYERAGNNIKQQKQTYQNLGSSQTVNFESLKDSYKKEAKEINELMKSGFDTTKDMYGNLEAHNREVITWTDNKVKQYQDIVTNNKLGNLPTYNRFDTSMVGTYGPVLPKKDTRTYVERGSQSTFLGGSNTFELNKDRTIDIAFSPLLQTGTGEPIPLSDKTVSEYIYGLIDNIDVDNLSDEEIGVELLKLDSEGLKFEGQKIKNLLADVGETAQKTGEALHLIGAGGSLEGVRDQLSVISTLGDYEQRSQAVNWSEKLNAGNLADEDYDKIAEMVGKVEQAYGGAKNAAEALSQAIFDNSVALLSNLETLDEMEQKTQELGLSQEALSKAQLDFIAQERESKLNSDDIKDYAKYIRDIAKSTKDFADELSDGSKQAAAKSRDLAVQILRMNEGVEELADNWKNWSDILKKSSHSSQEYMEALKGSKEAIGDLLDISSEYISEDYIQKHMKDIEAAAKGDEEAIDRLRAASLESVIVSIDFKDDDIKQKFVDTINGLQEIANNADVTIAPGMDLVNIDAGAQAYIDTLNDMIMSGQATAADVNAALSAIGYNPVYEEQEVQVPYTQTVTTTHHQVVKKGSKDIQQGNDTVTVEEWDDRAWTETEHIGEDSTYGIFGLGSEESPPTITGHKLSGISKKATGSYNNYSSKNAGGGSPGKSGGGGGGKEPKKKDKIDDEPDRYHKVNTQLTKIENQLDKIQSQEKKFIGAKLIDNLNAQLGKLDERIDNLRKKKDIAYGELEELRQKLAPQGVLFNADGTISNYMEIYNSKLAYVNSLIDQYNGMSAEQQEAFEETLEAAKQDYEKFKTELDRYDELVSDFIPGLENSIQDAIDEQIELNIKKFNIEFEVRLDMSEAQKDWNNFKKKILDGIKDSDILGNARARATDDLGVYLAGQDGSSALLGAGWKQTESVLRELRQMDATGWSNVYGDDRVSALDDLKEAYQNIEQSLLEIQQIQDDVAQAVLDLMDELQDKMEDVIDLMDTVDSQIEHDVKLIKLVFGETDFEAIGNYYAQRQANDLSALETARQNRDYWEAEMNAIEDKTSEAFMSAREKYLHWLEETSQLTEKAIEDAREKMENAIDAVFKKFNDEITNGKGLDYTQQQWDLINDVADQYLDKVNAAFGIRQLERKYQDAIDKTDNVSNQRKLNQLMQTELAALREKDKLTEYDVERANRRYEIELKRLALEEAQQTKNTMRLRRDSQGNYRYEYIADEENIMKLQDELDVLQNSLYNFDKERWLETQNQILDAVRDRQDAIKEIMMDASLTEEERMERLAEINELYNQKIQNITDQTVTAQTNLYQSGADELSKIWDEQEREFKELSKEEQRVLVEEMLPQFESGVNQMIEKFSGPGGFEDRTKTSMKNLSKVTVDYNQDLQAVEKAANQTFNEVRTGQDKVLSVMPQLISSAQEYVNKTMSEYDAVKKVNEELAKKIAYYEQIITKSKEAAQAAYDYWLKEQQIAAERAAAEQQRAAQEAAARAAAQQAAQAPAPAPAPQPSGGGGGGGGPSNGDKAEGVAAAIWIMGGGPSGWGDGSSRSSKLAAKFGDAGIVQGIINSQGPSGVLYRNWNGRRGELPNYYYGRFNTGGYTGDWAGDYGKLAWLDRKELVLNAHDTENMLDMMQIARDVIAASGIRAELLSANTGASFDAATGQLEQNVHIDANFPNVESAAEIEEALNNLVNLAAQRANRNTRG